MGLINYYRTHIPRVAELPAPLYNLVKKGARFKWTAEHDHSFNKLKELCAEGIALHPFQPNLPIAIYTDASLVACGGVLLQDNKPVEFYSKTFSPTEQRYPTGIEKLMILFAWRD